MKKIFSFIAIVYLMASCCNCNSTSYKSVTEEKGYGIDLSHHNTVEDWNKVTASYVMLKATEGATYQDPKFNAYREQAQKKGIPVGAYHLLSPTSKIKDQIRNYIQTVGNNIDIVPIIDVEPTKAIAGLGKETLRKMVRTFADECKKEYGCSSIILYTTGSYYKRYFSTGFDDCIFWSGDVNSKKPTNCVIHQKAIKAVPGVKGRVDYDVLYCDLSELMITKSNE